MSTIAPKTPDEHARKVAMNRSFSAAGASTSNRAQPTAEIGATAGVETLFTHASAKIVKFTSNAPTRPGSSGTWSPGGSQQQGTLPWATLTEKTMAAGPLEIYRVPGSVSFLHSGSLLHAIMPRSNCWCVDGVSKFAMRVLPDTYYRIELPGDTPEDLAKVEEFKMTLQKVLFYERTACPFARTFEVELPAEGEPKPRRRRRRTDGPAKKWRLDSAYSWKPEGWTPEQDGPSEGSSGSMTGSDEEGSSGSPVDLAEEVADQMQNMNINMPPAVRKPTVKDRARGINMRSVTAPPQLHLQSTQPNKLRPNLIPQGSPHFSDAIGGEQISENVHPIKAPHDAQEPESVSGASREEHSSWATPMELPAAVVADLEGRGPSMVSREVAVLDNAQDSRPLQPMPTDMPPSPPDSNVEFDFTLSNDVSPQLAAPRGDTARALEGILDSSSLHSGAETPVICDRSSQADQGPPAGVVEPVAASAGQLEMNPMEHSTGETDVNSTPSDPQAILEDVEDHAPFVTCGAQYDDPLGNNQVQKHVITAQSDQNASLPEVVSSGDTPLHNREERRAEPSIESGSTFEVDDNTEVYSEQPPVEIEQPATHIQPSPDTTSDAHLTRVPSSDSDPFAAIQARIQARRSIGGTTTQGFVPIQRQATRLSSTSTASSSSLHSQRRSQVASEKDRTVIATALVRKAASAFLGPPVHLVAIMLKIAARFAKGAFPKALLFESPAGMVKRVPGSFDLDDSDIEDELDEDEDDFGVPLRSPISRLGSGESVPRALVDSSVKERRGYAAVRG